MRTRQRSKVPLLIVSILLLAAVIVVIVGLLKMEQPEPDPHEGQVYINDGFGMVWMTPLEGVDVNPIQRGEMRVVNGQPQYTGAAFETLYGVDVSEHQWGIDWAQVAASGVDFAMIRLGYRGYTEGGLFEDPYFKSNMEGAAANGLELGVYMFSQAITVEEALEEADFVLEAIRDCDITGPVVFDWEVIGKKEARTYGLDTDTLCAAANAFCSRIREAGYQPMIYFNAYAGYVKYDLSRVLDYPFWFAQYKAQPDFYYDFQLWQYTSSGKVDGIQGNVDMDVWLLPNN